MVASWRRAIGKTNAHYHVPPALEIALRFEDRFFPRLGLGHEPSAQILCLSYAHYLSYNLARDFARLRFAQWFTGRLCTTVPWPHNAPNRSKTRQHDNAVSPATPPVGGRVNRISVLISSLIDDRSHRNDARVAITASLQSTTGSANQCSVGLNEEYGLQ